MKTYSLIALLSVFVLIGKAQTRRPGDVAGQKDTTTYMMPDGSFIPKDKIDSVRQAWNGALFLGHSDKDKAQGVVHLVRLTDADMKQMEDKNAKDELIVKAMEGQPAPDFRLKDLQGKEWSLAALKGKVVVINFWYTSCPPCLGEMPDLNKLTHLYPPGKVVFLALTFEDAAKVQAFLKTHEFGYTILPSSKAVDQQFKVSGWPTSLVINKAGIISFAANIRPDIVHDLSAAIDADL